MIEKGLPLRRGPGRSGLASSAVTTNVEGGGFVLLVSFLLVIVATVFLVAGLFLTKQDLTLIFISIGCGGIF